MEPSANKLTKDQIRAAYEHGAEAVIDLVRQLQGEIAVLRKRVRELETPINYDRFLSYLDPDPEEAARKYYQLLKALVSYLDWSLHSHDPEKHASETLDEISRKIGGGETFDDLNSYARRVARNIHFSERRGSREDTNSIDSSEYMGRITPSSLPEVDQEREEEERRVGRECMKRCYGQLSDKDQNLIARYSQASGHDKDQRNDMATELKTNLGALRARVFRIRQRLQKCREDCEGKALGFRP